MKSLLLIHVVQPLTTVPIICFHRIRPKIQIKLTFIFKFIIEKSLVVDLIVRMI